MISWLLIHTFYNSFSQEKSYYPDVVQPPPTAASLGKYGNIPVGNYTGIPNISIPLFSITSREQFKLDISLSYHASGVKVEEQASWVGLGWSLNAGGSISKKMVGCDDIHNSYFFRPNDDNVLLDFGKGTFYETEPDFYFYNFNGRSGKFVIDMYRNCIPIEANDLKISFSRENEFTIITEDGIRYCFDNKDIEKTTIEYYYNGHNDTEYEEYSNWYLSRIESPAGRILLEFVYESEFYKYETSKTTEKQYYQDETLIDDAHLSATHNNISQKISIKGKHLTHISSADGSEVEFETLDRSDLLPTPGYNDLPKRLAAIHVNNHLGTNVKNITFLNNSYFNDGLIPANETAEVKAEGYRLKLNGLIIDSEQQYSFYYYNPDDLPTKVSKQQDHWGYYHGREMGEMGNFPGYSGRVPNIKTPGAGIISTNAEISGVSRDASFPAMQFGTLRKITYPTKGYTQFEYQAHTTERSLYNVALPEKFKTGGGLRIYKITDFDGSINTNVREFSYSGGMLYNEPVYICFVLNEFQFGTSTPAFTRLVVSSANSSKIADEFSEALGYKYVTEHFINNGTDNGTIKYSYNNIPEDTYNDEEIDNNYQGNISVQLIDAQACSFSYDASEDFGFSPLSKSIFTIDIGKLLLKEFRNSNNKIVREETYDYTYTWDKSINGLRKSNIHVNFQKTCGSKFEYFLEYERYRIHTGTAILNSVIERQNGVYTSNQYDYESEFHHQPTRVTTYLRNGSELITEYKYPTDYTGVQELNVLKEMKDCHVINPVIEKIVYKKENGIKYVISAEYNLYREYYEKLFRPGTIYKFESTTPVEETIFRNSNKVTEDYHTISSYHINLYTDNDPGTYEPYELEETVNLNLPANSKATMSVHSYIVRNNCQSVCDDNILGCTYNCVEDWWAFAYGEIIYPNNITKREYYVSTNPACYYCINDKPTMCLTDPYCTTVEEGINLNSGIYTFHSKNKVFGNEQGHYHYHSYDNLIADIIVEGITQVVNFTHLKPLISFNYYDCFGNNIQITKTNDITTSYHWGYNERYPVIEATNLSYIDLETIAENALMSLSPDYSGIEDYDEFLDDVGVTVSNFSLLNRFNEKIRLLAAQKNSLIKTYTYFPSFGITSSTDENGTTTYYEYDNFGRLKQILNHDRKVVQKSNYNYSNKP
jgi:YD repeat-containing protein